MDQRATGTINIGSGGAPMTTSTEDYIPKVKAEHNAVCSGESGMLPHAIACGKLLSAVEDLLEQENSTLALKKNHVGLNKWAKDNCGIGQTTVSLYKRLWKAEADIRKAECKTIGEAKRDVLAKDPEKVKTAQARREAREKKIKEDKEQAISTAMAAFTPEEMFDQLSHLWGKEQLVELHKLLGAHLAPSTTRANQSGVATGATTTRQSWPQNELMRRA
jgi:hypothetical protein